jgi:basic amino acid/polyamine antiporter, APA family
MSSIALVIGITIGSGIFRSPSGIAQRVPHAGVMLGVWVVGGLITLCGALSIAELAASLPHTGGYYVYLREGWGRLTAFLFGWAQLVLISASGLGAIAIAFSDYALRTLDIDPSTHLVPGRALAAAAIAFAATVNVVGSGPGAIVVNASTAAKFAALGLLAGCGLLLGGAHGGTLMHLREPAAGPITVGDTGLALVSVLWAYDGFGDVSFAGGEIKNPQRTLPRAIVIGTVAIITIYLLTNAAYLYVNPIDVVARSPLIAADTMTAVFGPAAAALVSSLVAISAFGALNGIMLSSPRVFFAMADDGLFFRSIARVHPRFKTPYVAILLKALLGIVLVASRSFEALTTTFVIAIWPFYALCVAAIYRLRTRQPDLPRPYKVVGYPLVPAIFILAVIAFLVNALINTPVSTGVTFALILAGVPVYFLAFGRRSRRLGRELSPPVSD